MLPVAGRAPAVLLDADFLNTKPFLSFFFFPEMKNDLLNPSRVSFFFFFLLEKHIK